MFRDRISHNPWALNLITSALSRVERDLRQAEEEEVMGPEDCSVQRPRTPAAVRVGRVRDGASTGALSGGAALPVTAQLHPPGPRE